MNFKVKKLVKCEELERQIKMTCNFNSASCEFVQGRILKVDKTNVSFIEGHRVIVKIKDKKILLLYFNKENLFLYNRTRQISIKQLDILLKELKEC